MKDSYSIGKVFSIYTEHFPIPLFLDNIALYQVGENIMERGGEIFWHNQECDEITYIISGSADVYADDKIVSVKKGDIHVISRSVPHRIIANKNERLRYFYLGFDLNPKNDDDCYKEIASYYDNIKTEFLQDNGDVYTMINQLLKEVYTSDRKYNDMIFEPLIKTVLLYVYFLHLNRDGIPREKENEKNIQISGTVFNIVKYIDATATTIEHIADVAKEFNYSPSYISRIFKEKMGTTLREYVNEKKVEASFELLRSNKFSVSEIADMLHFDSYRSFYKKFKNVVGIPPTQYALQQSEKEQE